MTIERQRRLRVRDYGTDVVSGIEESDPKVDAFLADVEAVCREHGMTISHEDPGGLLVERVSDRNIGELWSAADVRDWIRE